VVQFGRAVGRAQDEGDPGMVGFEHGRVKLSGGGTAGGADDSGPTTGHGESEAVKGSAPFIEPDVHSESLRQSQGDGS